MDMTVNKTVAAILVPGIVFFLGGELGGLLIHGKRPERSPLAIATTEAAPAAAAPAAAALDPITPLLASANVANGQTIAQRQCASCHTFNEGGRNGVGPNLHGVVGAPHGHAAGFNYSASLKGKEGPWTYEQLNAWLNKPATYAPGNRMAFGGISNTQQRADVIAYLRSISPNAPAP